MIRNVIVVALFHIPRASQDERVSTPRRGETDSPPPSTQPGHCPLESRPHRDAACDLAIKACARPLEAMPKKAEPLPFKDEVTGVACKAYPNF